MWIRRQSFGAVAPANWAEIAAWLNGYIEEKGWVRAQDACEEAEFEDNKSQLWDEYWEGLVPGAPAPQGAA